MTIVEAVALLEKKKQESYKTANEIRELKNGIDSFCMSKVGWVVEQFGFKYYITKYKNEILFGTRIKKDTWMLIPRENREFIYLDKCKFIGKAEIREDNLVKLIYTI